MAADGETLRAGLAAAWTAARTALQLPRGEDAAQIEVDCPDPPETADGNPLRPFRIADEPYYLAVGDEIALFSSAYATRLPLMLKGPTGCGKTRFLEHMAWQLGLPLVTVSCHEDMTASNLVGRYLLDAEGTRWQDGPLTLAARHGALCYLDEVVEARQDTSVVIHPLTDARRTLPLEKRGELLAAHPAFLLVVSYNPGYQNAMKDLKASTRQRFGALALGSTRPPTSRREIVSPTRPASTPTWRHTW